MFNNNEKTKEIYEYCVNNNWNVTRIRELASSLSIPYEEVLYMALTYAKLNTETSEYQRICEIVSKNKKGRYDLDVPNPVLSKDDEVVYKLWRNDIEKEIVLKYIYDTWQVKDTSDIASQFGFNNEKIMRLLKEYALDNLKMSSSEWQELKDEIKIRKSRNKKRENLENLTGNPKFLWRLINTNSYEEIIMLLDDVDDLVGLRNSIHDYLIIYHDSNEYNKYRDIINSKLSFYAAYQKEKIKQYKDDEASRRELEGLPNAEKLIIAFVESDYNSVRKFIENCKVIDNVILNSDKNFEESLILVKKYNGPLYNRYKEKIEKHRQKNYIIMVNQILTIISLLKNGIVENDVKRPFDIVDYFRFTKLTLYNILNVAKNMEKRKIIDSKSYSLLGRFCRNNLEAEKMKYSDIELILSEKEEFNCQKNSKGYPISGTGEVISYEIKEKCIYYLVNNNLPINYKTCHALLNRYKLGLLDLNDVKKY